MGRDEGCESIEVMRLGEGELDVRLGEVKCGMIDVICDGGKRREVREGLIFAAIEGSM